MLNILQDKYISLKMEFNHSFILSLIKYLFIFILLVIFYLFEVLDNNKEIEFKNNLAKIQNNPNSLIWNNVKHDFEILVNKYKYLIKKEENIEEDSPIWVMWYQGIENAPPIVKSCIQSIVVNRVNHPVNIIDKNNLEKYIKLPYFVIENFHSGNLSIQHFSDIIRMALLHKYGGYWIDATYFINTPLTKVNTSFYTLKLKHCWAHSHTFIDCSYSINFLAVPKKSFIATYGYNALIYYLKKYKYFISYLLLDYIIYIAIIKVPEFKEIINNLPSVTCNIFSLDGKLKFDYNESDFCSFNKLRKSSLYELKNGKNLTNYGYIIKRYKFKSNKDDNDNIINV